MRLVPQLLLLLSWMSLSRANPDPDHCTGAPCETTGTTGTTGDPRPCTGSHCPGGGRTSRPPRHLQLLQTPDCAAAAGDGCKAEHASPGNQTRACRGVECRLPLRVRPGARARAGTPEEREPGPPVHVSDRAAQFLGDFPEFGFPAPEVGSAPLGVQLTCDIKPGENEVPSEDALILHLQLSKGQETLVEALRAQQAVVKDLQQKLVEQQDALLSQQRDILEQQRHMYQQMDAVKAQYEMLSETVKQASFQGLQGELQSYLESQLSGLQSQARSHLHKSYAVHKMDLDSKGMDVVGEAHFPQPLLGCPSPCGTEHFCDFQKDPPQCESCTMCPPGFFLISQCSPTADRMCQDRDECLEVPNICGERVKCLNTPGGFRCLGVSEREALLGLCGQEYFYNQELQECQACSDCMGETIAVPCSAVTDAVCGQSMESQLSQSWASTVTLPSARNPDAKIYPGLQLIVRSKDTGQLLSNEAGRLVFRQHGLVWVDYNFAVKHTCRNFLQLGMRLNGSQEEEGQDLSGVRIEQPDGKYFQGVSMSSGMEVEPNHTFALLLKSPNNHCNRSKDILVYDISAPTFSLLWLSHDTGAVAMSAQMSLHPHYQTSYRPSFRVASVSDPYMIGLTHDSRGIRFTERGSVKFVLQQALYSMGHTCVKEGFTLTAFTNHNGTSHETTQSFKTGVNYRDTSVTLSGVAVIEGGDTLGFEVTSPSQCNIRYFGDGTGISVLSLIWIPSALSSALTATVVKTGLPSGAVRNKPLLFDQTSPDVPQVQLARPGEPNARKNFVFHQRGTANVALNLKLIHSCNVLKLTLQRVGGPDQGSPGPVAQQVSGHMPEGSEWATVGLRVSFSVQNGTAVYATLDCVRGRVNHVTREGGTNISILWVAV